MGKEKGRKDNFLACTQAAGIGEATREILKKINLDRKPVPWQQLGLLNLNLPPVHRLPALVLLFQLGIQIHQSRAKGKSLEIGMLTSTLRIKADVLVSSKNFKNAKHVVVDWIENLWTGGPLHLRHPPQHGRRDARHDIGNALPAPNG